MAQFARPSADVSTGSWTVTPLWSQVDDSVGSGDADEIASINNATDTCELTLSSISAPAAGTVTMRWRSRKGATGGMTILETFELKEGATVRATYGPTAIPDSTAFATRSYALTTGERDAITNWGNLSIQITRSHTGSSNRNLRVADFELEAPDAGGAPPISGTGAITAAAHTISGSGKQSFTATGAITAAAHSLAATGKLSFVASGTITAAPAALSASGKLAFTGTGSFSAAAHAISGSGDVTISSITGTGAITAAPHTIAGTGNVTSAGITGTGAITAAPHAVSGTGKLAFRATGAITAAPGSVAGTGSLVLSGTGAITAAAHSVSGSGTLRFTGTGSITAAAHSISGSGNATVVIEGVAVVSDSAFGAAIVLTVTVQEAFVEDVNYYQAIVSDEG